MARMPQTWSARRWPRRAREVFGPGVTLKVLRNYSVFPSSDKKKGAVCGSVRVEVSSDPDVVTCHGTEHTGRCPGVPHYHCESCQGSAVWESDRRTHTAYHHRRGEHETCYAVPGLHGHGCCHTARCGCGGCHWGEPGPCHTARCHCHCHGC